MLLNIQVKCVNKWIELKSISIYNLLVSIAKFCKVFLLTWTVPVARSKSWLNLRLCFTFVACLRCCCCCCCWNWAPPLNDNRRQSKCQLIVRRDSCVRAELCADSRTSCPVAAAKWMCNCNSHEYSYLYLQQQVHFVSTSRSASASATTSRSILPVAN